MANRQVYQLVEKLNTVSTDVLPIQIGVGSTELAKVTIDTLFTDIPVNVTISADLTAQNVSIVSVPTLDAISDQILVRNNFTGSIGYVDKADLIQTITNDGVVSGATLVGTQLQLARTEGLATLTTEFQPLIAQLEIDVSQNSSDITTNVTNIGTNTGDIVTNTADIATNAFWRDLTQGFYGTSHLDSVTMSIAVNVGVVEFTVRNKDLTGDGSFRVEYVSGIVTYPITTITLAEGTDTVPTQVYIYSTFAGGIQSGTGQMEIDLAGTEYSPFATSMLPSAALIAVDGPYKLHSWIDHLFTSDTAGNRVRGHLSHLNERIRQDSAIWNSGMSVSYNLPASTRVDVNVTSGWMYQLHLHSTPSFTTVLDADDLHVINDVTVPYRKITNIAEIAEDGSGNVLVNNSRYSFVVWAVISESDPDSQLMVNLPTQGYANDIDALNDVNGYTDFSIPSTFKGASVLLSRIVLHYNSGGNWSLVSGGVFDLRGIGIGGVGGGGGAPNILAKESIEVDTDDFLHLVNDEDVPADGKFYGKLAGVKAWHPIPDHIDKAFKSATVVQKVAAYNIVEADNNYIIECSGTFTITAPIGLSSGFQLVISNIGTGIITIATAGILRSKAGANKLDTQYTGATIYNDGSDNITVFGDLVV